ncbi:LysR family transcriptional regulator [Massilia sp. NR 4-1]|uniref:helix-turn-helix domain-containing protein n=1 Tax=Massilia sp. NR 4-1 TaxID=1678028 RepID=UPI00067DCE05|nr:LysR family transcriptional regulator [Massilia sp. NR 4-1]AKU21899.1 hypothetical protein ACZ75_10885 [Massilia sp. NR 4-1]
MTTTSNPHWLVLLRAEAERTSIAQAAQRIGYSRTTVSQALSSKYPGDLSKLESAVLMVLEEPLEVDCPYLGLAIPLKMCREFSVKSAPTHNPVAMQHWRACQKCQNRCKGN